MDEREGSQHNNLASNTVPLLDSEALPAGDAGGGGSAGGGTAMSEGMGSMMKGMGNRGGGMMGAGMAAAGMGRGRMGEMMGDRMGRMGAMQGGAMSAAEAKKQLKTLTRTDFLLQFVWKPVERDELPKTEEEEKTRLKELVDKMKEAEKDHPAVTMPKEEDIEAASQEVGELDTKLQTLAPGGPRRAPLAHPGLVPGPWRPGVDPAAGRRGRSRRDLPGSIPKK